MDEIVTPLQRLSTYVDSGIGPDDLVRTTTATLLTLLRRHRCAALCCGRQPPFGR